MQTTKEAGMTPKIDQRPGASLLFDGQVLDSPTLMQRAACLAGGLRRLGLKEGGVVAVLLRNDSVIADIIYACRIAGTHFCSLNWHLTPAEIGYILCDSGAAAIIGHGDLLDAAAAIIPAGVPILAVGPCSCSGAMSYQPWLDGQSPYDGPNVPPRAHMTYTSGTTGRPKGVRRLRVPPQDIAKQRAQAAALAATTLGTIPGCRALLSAPLYHSAPSVFFQEALDAASLVVLASRFDAEQTLALIERHRITVVYLVPVMYVRLLRLPAEVRNSYDLSSLRFVASTGAPCPPDVKQTMIAWLGPVITETYASTETGFVTTVTAAESLERPGSAGRAVGDAEIRIIDAKGRPCATGEVGTVYVRQPIDPDFTYHGQPEARQAIERDGLITLGDMGYLDADGYLYLCDRASDVVISGGVNIYPAETEHALLRCPGVLDCAVFGVPDQEYGERLHALVQPEPGAALDLAAIATRLRDELAGFKLPRSFDLVVKLPRDDNGKIARRRLRAAYWKDQPRQI
jgi:long-chain acyl-CoA synthetase